VTNERDPRLDLSAVRARYDDLAFFSNIDPWHLFTAAEVRREVASRWASLPTGPNHIILNAGAGGNDLGLDPPATINLDISPSRISSMLNPIVASIEALPLSDGCIDTLICVGSVINYCDAAAAIGEFGRVVRPSGALILEFESSFSAELITQEAFGRSAAVAETFYANQEEAVWVYSPSNIRNLLHAASFTVIQSVPIHILSPWALLLSRRAHLATSIARLDRFVRGAPLLTRWASNHLFFCEKQT
jgi:SAM-dependent methyltransferase